MSLLFRYTILSLVCLGTSIAPCIAEVRIKDITDVEGAQSNQLKGLGLVSGLNRTGSTSLATQQLAIDMLRKLDMTAKIARQSQSDNVFKSTNISAVMVTTELPPFARKGSRLDVTVSVIDDATSLEGGSLIFSTLEGADREVYVTAQGPVSIGGFNDRTIAAGVQKKHSTVGLVLNGGIVVKQALGEINQGGVVRFLLRNTDYSTAQSIVKVINQKYPAAANAIDEGTIQVRIPLKFARDLTTFVNEVGLLTVVPDAVAKVVINERTGTVIVGHRVRISAASFNHANLSIKPNVSLVPATDADGMTPLPGAPPPRRDGPGDEIDDILSALRPRELPRGPQSVVPLRSGNVDQTFTVDELARVLNALGVTPRDLISIFQALKKSGLLHAELVFM
jgi:flagellar P-ring protein precursor FlgI